MATDEKMLQLVVFAAALIAITTRESTVSSNQGRVGENARNEARAVAQAVLEEGRRLEGGNPQ